MKLLNLSITLLILFSFIIVITPQAKAESEDFQLNNVVYIVSGKSFIDNSKDIVLSNNFYVWHSFPSVDIIYEKDGYQYINGNYRSSLINIELVDGAHLKVIGNGTVYYDCITHTNTAENVIKYEMGIIYDGMIVTVIISIMLACGFNWNKWTKIKRRLIG